MCHLLNKTLGSDGIYYNNFVQNKTKNMKSKPNYANLNLRASPICHSSLIIQFQLKTVLKRPIGLSLAILFTFTFYTLLYIHTMRACVCVSVNREHFHVRRNQKKNFDRYDNTVQYCKLGY